MTRVIFFQVSDTTSKLRCLAQIAKKHFVKKESILFFVEDEKAQNFLDEFLWKFPETSFLPHSVLEEATKTPTPIAITKSKTNTNAALIAFNLCPTPLFLPGFKIIYELEDMTTSAKQKLSSLRFEAYKQAGLPLESTYP